MRCPFASAVAGHRQAAGQLTLLLIGQLREADRHVGRYVRSWQPLIIDTKVTCVHTILHVYHYVYTHKLAHGNGMILNFIIERQYSTRQYWYR